MEIRSASVDQLLALFDPGRPLPILLLGAGASVRSGVPLSADLVELAGKWKFCRTHHRHVEDPTIKRTDWLNWLHGHPWYDQSKRPEDNYSEVVENLLIPKGDRKEFFLWSLSVDVPPSSGYEHLLELLGGGFLTTVLTTNFDRILPDLKAARKRPHHLEIIRTPDETVAFSTSPTHPQLVYLHGAVEYYTDQNLTAEVQRLKPQLVDLLTPLLRDHPLIVIGYRGAEPSIMTHLLAGQADAANRFAQGIFWCSISPTFHPLVANLNACVSPNLQFVLVPGFDEVMETISHHCESLPKKAWTPAKSLPAEGLPFDMTPLPEATMEELDSQKIREQLTVYCERMKIDLPTPLTNDWIEQQLCSLDLAVRRNSTLVPTIAGYLLFGINPAKRVRSAFIEVTENGLPKKRIDGNLWLQKDAIDSFLEDLNRPFILKKTNNEVVHPYPKVALRELCVNALVHRTYSGTKGVVIELERNCIRISNPGGLVEEVADRVHTTLQQQIEAGITGIKGYRNSVIADLFCGSGRMEKQGSGLPDVHRSVSKNGGKVFFGPTDKNSAFKAIIYRRPEEVDTSTGTATPTTNVSRYSSNLLELISMPEEIWVYPADNITERGDWASLSFPSSRKGRLSFIDPSSSQIGVACVPTAELLSTGEGRREVVGLLNQCLQTFLRHSGLVVDQTRKRAYFPRTKQGPREIRYQAKFRQATRTVTKPFISRTSERVLYWIHEAIWFGFERFSSQFVLRLLPGYVFTVDGVEVLLNHRRVGALATRKAARDFSLQVFNHLIFWSFVLSNGQQHISIPTGGNPIRLSATFAGCDLPMPAGADIQFEPDEFQMRADSELDALEQEIQEDAEQESGTKPHGT